MAVVQDWVDVISLDLPEPLSSTVARQVRFALQVFFRDSEAWRHAENITVSKGEQEFYINELPVDTYAIASHYAYFTPTGGVRRKLESTLNHRISQNSSQPCRMFAVLGEKVLIDGNTEDGVLELSVIVQPKRDVDEVPDEIAEKWFDDIFNGAMAKLMAMPGKIWTEPKAAMAYAGMFTEAIEKAKREARSDRSRPKRAVRFNTGFSW